jgi:hypothetical protein
MMSMMISNTTVHQLAFPPIPPPTPKASLLTPKFPSSGTKRRSIDNKRSPKSGDRGWENTDKAANTRNAEIRPRKEAQVKVAAKRQGTPSLTTSATALKSRRRDGTPFIPSRNKGDSAAEEPPNDIIMLFSE